MRKKKRGATLIVVIIIFMFVCSVSMAMVSMVAGNYTARVSENKRIENLYSSESGIDMAYNIAGKTIIAGIKYGYYQVSQLRGGYGDESENKTHYNDLNKDIKLLTEDIDSKYEEIAHIQEYGEGTEDDAKAIEKLLKEIKKCQNGIETDKLTKNEVYKEEFKRAFKVYIQNEKDATKVPEHMNVLEDSIKNKNYIDVSLTYKDDEPKNKTDEATDVSIKYTGYGVEFPNVQKGEDKDGKTVEWPQLSTKLIFHPEPNDKRVKISNIKGSDEKTLKMTEYEDSEETHKNTVSFDRVTDEYYDLIINSQFLSKESNTMVIGENSREIEGSYKIKVPNYDDVLWGSSTGDIKDYTVFKDNRGITIGGNMDIDGDRNMDINDDGNLDVKGDVFVQGNPKSDTTDHGKVYNKYKGGIKINKRNVNFLPVDNSGDNSQVNINTRGTFNIQNDSEVKVGSNSTNGNIYAKNIYAGDITRDEKFTNGSSLNVNNVVTDNDLTVQATSTIFNIQNFYGINDKNVKYDDMKIGDRNNNPYTYNDGDSASERDTESGAVEKSSSSIIINGHKDSRGNGASTVNINNEAYIMGTAHIGTEGNYQTGESIAVKGNYTAYAVPVSPDEKFKYDKPLQVLDEDNIFKKAEHFNDYWNGKGKDSNGKDSNGKDSTDTEGIQLSRKDADNGGIILPENTENIHSIGAIVYKTTSSSGEEQTGVRESNYNMADEQKGRKVYEKRAEYAKRVYDLGVNKYGKEYDYIDSYSKGEIKADKVENLLSSLTEDNINSIANHDWATQKSEWEEKGTPAAIFNPDPKITITITKDLSAVIVTNGDVEIDSSDSPVNFKGNIIAKGNLTVRGKSNVTIAYDKKTVTEVQEKNGELFTAVFKKFEDLNVEDKESENKTMLKQVLDGQYDIKRYLVNRFWKLIR